MAELIALLDGNEVGRVRSDARGRLTFIYDNAWRNAEGAYPLSLSMPLAAEEHGPAAIHAFLRGLLPDNEQVLERWAKKFQVSARNVLALISNVGEDCAGAVQFITPDRLETLKTGRDDKIEWLDEPEIANRLQALREDHAAWRLPRDTVNSALRAPSRKPLFCYKTVAGVFPRGESRPPIYLSRQPGISTGMRRMSTSACGSQEPSGCRSQIRGSCSSRTKSPSSSTVR